MSADEMFEKLGYINNTYEFCKRYNTGKNKIFVEYMLPLENRNFDRKKHITFWKDKTVTVGLREYDEEDELQDVYIGDITLQEIKAINQKCKELGWIE